jgi:gas vesicle protein
MSTGKVLLGLMAGFAAGALVGVLLAPEKGSETRKKLSKLGGDYADDLTDKFNELKNSIVDKLQSVNEDGMKVVEKAKSGLSEMKSTASTGRSSSSGSGQGGWSNQQG